MEKATFGAGCFWGVEAAFRQVKGVVSTAVGYMGGTLASPTYQDVCTDRTGHAEVVQVEFDPEVISFRDILEIFFTIHDPTTLNRQGADIGTQYRSAIFYHTPEQKEVADQIISEMNAEKVWDAPIVTEVAPFKDFYPAEDYHREYFQNNPAQPYCQVVIAPKVAKFRQKYFEKLKREN